MSRLLKPDYYVSTVCDISPEWCKAEGIKALLLDLDNTLTGWRDRTVPEGILEWIELMRSKGVTLFLLTNCRSRRRVREMAELLDMPAIGWASKPRAKGYRRALDALGLQPDEVAGVGDQMLTDVVGANRVGLCSIMVSPLMKREFVLNYLFRWFERFYLRRVGMGEPTVLSADGEPAAGDGE